MVARVTHEVCRVKGSHVLRQFASEAAAQAFRDALAARFRSRRYAVRKIQGGNDEEVS